MSKTKWEKYSKARQKAIKWEIRMRNAKGMLDENAARIKFNKWSAESEQLWEEWQNGD